MLYYTLHVTRGLGNFVILVGVATRTWLDQLGFWSWSRIYINYIVGNASFCLLHTFQPILYTHLLYE